MWSPWPSLRQLLPLCDDPEFLWEVLPVRAWVWVSPFLLTCETILSRFTQNNNIVLGLVMILYKTNCSKRVIIFFFFTEALHRFKVLLPGQNRAGRQNVKWFCSSQRRDCPLARISGRLFNSELCSQWGICCKSNDAELCFPKWPRGGGILPSGEFATEKEDRMKQIFCCGWGKMVVPHWFICFGSATFRSPLLTRLLPHHFPERRRAGPSRKQIPVAHVCALNTWREIKGLRQALRPKYIISNISMSQTAPVMRCLMIQTHKTHKSLEWEVKTTQQRWQIQPEMDGFHRAVAAENTF